MHLPEKIQKKSCVIIFIKYNFYYVKMSLMFHACTNTKKNIIRLQESNTALTTRAEQLDIS